MNGSEVTLLWFVMLFHSYALAFQGFINGVQMRVKSVHKHVKVAYNCLKNAQTMVKCIDSCVSSVYGSMNGV